MEPSSPLNWIGASEAHSVDVLDHSLKVATRG
jgi:hypothetical protein